MKILVVEDSEMVRNYYYYILKTAGFTVISAIDGADGIEKLVSFPDINLIISNINMPNMDGYTMIEKIRQELQIRDIPIIIISTEDKPGDMEKGFDVGANIYLVKPIEPEILINNINSLFNGVIN